MGHFNACQYISCIPVSENVPNCVNKNNSERFGSKFPLWAKPAGKVAAHLEKEVDITLRTYHRFRCDDWQYVGIDDFCHDRFCSVRSFYLEGWGFCMLLQSDVMELPGNSHFHAAKLRRFSGSDFMEKWQLQSPGKEWHFPAILEANDINQYINPVS